MLVPTNQRAVRIRPSIVVASENVFPGPPQKGASRLSVSLSPTRSASGLRGHMPMNSCISSPLAAPHDAAGVTQVPRAGARAWSCRLVDRGGFNFAMHCQCDSPCLGWLDRADCAALFAKKIGCLGPRAYPPNGGTPRGMSGVARAAGAPIGIHLRENASGSRALRNEVRKLPRNSDLSAFSARALCKSVRAAGVRMDTHCQVGGWDRPREVLKADPPAADVCYAAFFTPNRSGMSVNCHSLGASVSMAAPLRTNS